MKKIDENTIQNWIVEENLFKEKIFDENANFHYVIEFPQGNIMDIVQPKGKDDLLVIVCGTQVSPEHVQLMNGASAKDRENFIFELRFKLNMFESDFQLDVSNDLILGQFIIQDSIYSDGLSKNELMKSLRRIFKSKMTCVWLIEKEFGQPNGSHSSSGDNVMFM